MKFQVPFELMVVFSTNLNPHDLADEAFLRRIQTKVLVENVIAEVFDEIFQRVVAATRCHASRDAPSTCASAARTSRREELLRACYPMDIYRLVKAISEYEGRPVAHDAGEHRSRGGAVLREVEADGLVGLRNGVCWGRLKVCSPSRRARSSVG